jgi:hypothetical protein
MSKIRIPAAALEAGARTLCGEQRLFWHGLTTAAQDIIRAEVRAAFFAMLEAWEGVQHDNYVIVLPLPEQENSDE